MSFVLLLLTAVLYLAATVVCLYHLLARRGDEACASTVPLWLLLAGFAFHGGSMGADALGVGTLPVMGPIESMAFFAWLVVGLFLALSLRYRLPTLGAFVAPVALAATLAALTFRPEQRAVPAALQTFWFPLHVVSIFLGEASFAVAFAVSLAFLVQEHQIRVRRQIPLLRRLPPLEVLDEIVYRSIAFAFPVMTLGMVTGSLWAKHAWGVYWSWDPRLALALATWMLIAGVLHARITVGWRGRRMALLTVAAFLLMAGSFTIVNVLKLGRHLGDFR